MDQLQEITILPFDSNDQSEAKALILAGLKEHWSVLDPSLNPDLDDIGLAYARGIFLVAWQNNEIIGTGALVPRPNAAAEIVRMSVAASARRKGVGRRILQELCEWARSKEYRYFVLETTETWQDAIEFYKAFGFQVTYFLDGDVYFSLNLLEETQMETYDDDLNRFEAIGAAPLPLTLDQGWVEHDGARIWYAAHGSGSPVILLHGGMGHGGNWGYQVSALVSHGYRAILIDSRGHGRSTRDARPFTYELMASDVLAVMDTLNIQKTALVGWSDGACIALILAANNSARAAGVFFFACNMDPSGTKEIEFTPTLQRCFSRHTRDYAELSTTPDQFNEFADAVGLMQRTQPNYSAKELGQIHLPVWIVQSEHDEFIKPEHAEYLARSIPNAELVKLPGVSHFAPLQRPGQFNMALLAFLEKISR